MKPAQKYKNEYRAQKRRKLILKSVLILSIVFIGTIGIVYLLFFSKFVDIRSVTINGAETIEQADISSAVNNWLSVKFWRVARKNNSLFISSEKLSAYLSLQFPKLESAKIIKNYPHGLNISVVERKPSGVWCLPAQTDLSARAGLSGRCFYFDKNAIAYASTSGSAGFLLATIYDERNTNIALGFPVASDLWFKNILLARELLSEGGINIAEFAIPANAFDEFDAKTAEGWNIMFSNQTNIAKQISSLNIFLKEKIKPEQRAKLQYVDLRIKDRVYFR